MRFDPNQSSLICLGSPTRLQYHIGPADRDGPVREVSEGLEGVYFCRVSKSMAAAQHAQLLESELTCACLRQWGLSLLDPEDDRPSLWFVAGQLLLSDPAHIALQVARLPTRTRHWRLVARDEEEYWSEQPDALTKEVTPVALEAKDPDRHVLLAQTDNTPRREKEADSEAGPKLWAIGTHWSTLRKVQPPRFRAIGTWMTPCVAVQLRIGAQHGASQLSHCLQQLAEQSWPLSHVTLVSVTPEARQTAAWSTARKLVTRYWPSVNGMWPSASCRPDLILSASPDDRFEVDMVVQTVLRQKWRRVEVPVVRMASSESSSGVTREPEEAKAGIASPRGKKQLADQ
jgi:hypothetical protein